MSSMEKSWEKKIEDTTGKRPTVNWATENFGSGQKGDKYTLDIGYLFTKHNHTVQAMHVDYLRRKQMMENWVGFMPLTAAGMFIEIWPGRPHSNQREYKRMKQDSIEDNRMEGSMVFIPYGVLMLVRGDTVHAGAMHCDTHKNPYGNPRLHFYIKTSELAVTAEVNGNRWYDYDSQDVSDHDTPHEKALRQYPPFEKRRKHAECLGYDDVEDGVNRRGNSLSTNLFSEMREREKQLLKKKGWKARRWEQNNDDWDLSTENKDEDKKQPAKNLKRKKKVTDENADEEKDGKVKKTKATTKNSNRKGHHDKKVATKGIAVDNSEENNEGKDDNTNDSDGDTKQPSSKLKRKSGVAEESNNDECAEIGVVENETMSKNVEQKMEIAGQQTDLEKGTKVAKQPEYNV